MKNIKLFLFAFLTFTLMSATCEPDPIEEECLCKIQGTKQISFDGGSTWQYSGLDERTNLMFPCYYDSLATNQETNPSNGVMYRIYWECKD